MDYTKKASEIKAVVDKIENDFVSLNILLKKIAELFYQPKLDIKEIAKLIAVEPVLTARVIKIANSIIFFPSTYSKITTVKDAVIRIGTVELKNLILGIASAHIFRNRILTLFDPHKLWEHSVATAFVTRIFMRRINVSIAELAFTSGLLHDIGKLILERYYNDKYQQVIKIVNKENISIYKAEEETLGFNHTDIAGAFGQLWNFPPDLVIPIKFHHMPLYNPKNMNKEIALAINYADNFCKKKNIGYSGDKFTFEFDDNVLKEFFNLNKGEISIIEKEFENEYSRFIGWVNILENKDWVKAKKIAS